MRRTALVLLLLPCACTPPAPPPQPADAAQPSDPEAELVQLVDQAVRAHASGDFETSARLFTQALALRDDPTLRYNLACAQARLGQRDAALASLRVLLDLRIDYGAGTDGDFASLREDAEFIALVAEFEGLFPPVHRSRTELVIDRVDIGPEGIAHAAGRTFISSMTTPAIYEVDAEGRASKFADMQFDGVPLSSLGLAIDTKAQRLWAVGLAYELVAGHKPEHVGTTGVFAFDLSDGKLVETRMWPGKHPNIGFNDLALRSDGTIYASGGGLHVAAPGQGFAMLETSEPLAFSNGLALTPDEQFLYAAAGPLGIARVRLSDGNLEWVQRPSDQYIRGFDGLYYTNERLVGVQHGQGGRWRCLQLELDPTGLVVERARVLEQKHPTLSFATTAYLDGDAMIVLAGQPVPPERAHEVPANAGEFGVQPVLERVPLF